MKVLMVEPDKVPYETEIEGGLESLQAAVGGDIQATYPYVDPVALICNEEGKLNGLPLNRALYDSTGNVYDIIAGNFLIVGLGEEDFTGLSSDLMEKFREQFKHPEKFVRIAGKILAVKQPVPENETGAAREDALSHAGKHGKDTYSIYQLIHSDSTDPYLFMSYDWVERKGLSVERDNYQMVYSAELMPGDTLNTLYEKFNLDHPADFKGHSLSVSDVVVLHKDGRDTAYYVDSIGFKELPDFLGGAGEPEVKRDVSVKEQIGNAKKQAERMGQNASGKKNREPERS